MTDNQNEEETFEILGIDLPAIDHELKVVEALFIGKAIDMETGKPTLVMRSSDGLSSWEAVGMLSVISDWLKEVSYDLTEESEDGDDA